MKNKICLLVLAVFILSCEKKNTETKSVENKPIVSVPEFSQDSAYAFIQKQVDFGPRFPNSKGHVNCGDYLVKTLKGFGAEVIEQPFDAIAFDGKKLFMRNIIASFNPGVERRILLSAHWDTRPFSDKDQKEKGKPFDGANDGGSGVGILLEIARILKSNSNTTLGLDIILFDGEDSGDFIRTDGEDWCLGSQYWSTNKHKKGYSAYYGILLDMVGAKNATFYKETGSMQYAKVITNKIWSNGTSLGYGSYFIDQQTPGSAITDDHMFVNQIAKIPMTDIIELDAQFNFGAYHHTQQDNMSVIDRNTLKAVGQTVLYTIYQDM